jgi:hypothetical protein
VGGAQVQAMNTEHRGRRTRERAEAASGHALVLQVANIAGIATGTVIRYLSYRRWVFPAHEAPAAGYPHATETARAQQ